MPELPEVENVVRSLNGSFIINSSIVRIEVLLSKVLKEVSPEDFSQKLEGKKIERVERKGKWIFFILQETVVVAHLRMTGLLLFEPLSFGFPSLIFHFEKGKRLFFYDERGFGVFHLQNRENFKDQKPYRDIGKDIVQEGGVLEVWVKAAERSRKRIKTFLLEQKVASGIGNIYCSEILFAARINPNTIVSRLNLESFSEIVSQSRRILQDSIKEGGTSISHFVNPEGKKGNYQNKLQVYGRGGKTCFRCQKKIVRIVMGGRSTFFCPGCQPEFLENT